MVRVRLLGVVALEIDGRAVELPPGRPTELLAWLAAHPGRHPRSRVASIFWPEVTDSTARASLRTALWALRRALGPAGEAALVLDRNTVGLDGPEVWVDLRRRDTWSRDEIMSADVGAVLPGIEGEWADQVRADHRAAVVSLLAAVDEEAEAAGDGATNVRVARRLTEVEPYAEEYHRLLLRRLVLAGERAAAIREHREFRRRLLEELGVRPSPATIDIAERVLASPDDAGAPDEIPVRLARLEREVIVGREAERQRLLDQWSRSRRFAGVRVVVLEGEAGVGKTRLLADFAGRVRDDGGRVLFGAALEEHLLPAEPFVEAVGARQAFGTDELLDAVRHELEAAMAGVPLALLLDDFQWADSVSFSLLRRLVRLSSPHGMTVVVAHRSEGEPDPKLVTLVAGIARDVPVTRVALAPLALEATAALLDDLDPGGRLAARAEVIHRDTQGNPFFVRELGRYLVERPGTPGATTPVPDTVRDLVAARLAGLSQLAGEAVSLAAVLGPRVRSPVLQRMLPGKEILEPLEEAVAAGLLEEEDAGLHTFRHALVRHAVCDLLSKSRQADLHRRAADALRALHGEGDGPHLCDIAEHRCAAVPVDSRVAAAADARRAGRWAVDHLAHDRAVVVLTKALQVCEPAARQELTVLRAIAFQRLTHDVIDAAGA